MTNQLKNIYFRLFVLLLAIFKSTDLFERINQLHWYKKALQQWVDEHKIPASSKILEAGCATGALSAYLAHSGFTPTGIDFSASMIKRAKSNYSGIEFIDADVLDIPLTDNLFDVVLATSLINIVDDKQKAINELTRVCKVGGKLSILVPCDRFTDEHLNGLLSSIGNSGFSAAALKTWHKSAPKMSERELIELLKHEGFSHIIKNTYLQGMVISISAIKP